MSSPLFICASSYGAHYATAHGQAQCAHIAAEAGATGIEIRQELLSEHDQPLETLGEKIAELGLECHYSSTDLLWLGEHLNDRLHAAIEDAKKLKASLIKVAIGALPSEETRRTTLAQLAEWLEGSQLTVALENDQTSEGGTPEALSAALEAFKQAGIKAGFTFDIGNWQYVGVNAIDAAHELGRDVIYVHCKGVRREGNQLHAAPPSPSELVDWSTMWKAFPRHVKRSIEFPLAGDDRHDHDSHQLISNSASWVTRLSHL
ncbi:sugar phosphate isomerase/epimerase family protein [Carnimonas nigrificans]|uniref:sugar phosphate isomerase/epimerase family protein n=1 Tax=Carnimonas nigrificans TaxID=64323 RepID=UPI0004711B27|nr:TIM barrel protein [Carnimonas nigrificans]